MKDCILCGNKKNEIIWQDNLCRFVVANEDHQFGIHRLIWNDHVKELSFLSKENQNHIFNQLIKAEKFILEKFKPYKINVASLGNLVPHLHWHIIPRWKTDPWWPNSIWDKIKRPKWSKILISETSESRGLVCIADWINLKTYANIIREQVFIGEQKIHPDHESDELDFISRHVIIKIEDKPIATVRLQPNGEIDKLAVIKKYRHLGFGKLALKRIISEAKSKNFSKISISSKITDSAFYKREGFTPQGGEFTEYNHIYQRMIITW
jgi:diadenosine tetraphosphate (Ap4A) HIT family hydrolase/predicted GNAT family N-acyltransferase